MDNDRMSNADMVQYCNEALAWEELGPIDIMFFDTVKRIILGELSVSEAEDQETIFDNEGFFNETETTGDYYNPDPDSTIQF
ncbi:MAG: hypothetical protein PUC41_03325 [Oscillospiraceae bacterium]|nr:hypothetical protein [Oscillospiraceae bacterium]